MAQLDLLWLLWKNVRIFLQAVMSNGEALEQEEEEGELDLEAQIRQRVLDKKMERLKMGWPM